LIDKDILLGFTNSARTLRSLTDKQEITVHRVTSTQLRLLLERTSSQFVPNRVQELHVRLLGVLIERRDERVGHGPGGLVRNVGVRALIVGEVHVSFAMSAKMHGTLLTV
jgi:hypothetical protein